MRYKCLFCEKLTTPFVWIGAMAVGPKCAQKHGLTPGKTKSKAIRFTQAAKRERGPYTLDLFENGTETTVAADGT